MCVVYKHQYNYTIVGVSSWSFHIYCNGPFSRDLYFTRITNVDSIRDYIFTNLGQSLVVSMEHDSFVRDSRFYFHETLKNIQL